MSMRFDELPISKDILKAVADMGFEEATPIQILAIPQLLEGGDIIGQAQTGTGKTAAFGIPMLEKVDAHEKKTQALVLCPTRELAMQVAEELTALAARKKGLYVLPVYGGQPMDRQLRALSRGVHVVVGTPGRVLDHLQRGSINLSAVRLAVLDEADEMMDMGFRDDMEAILSRTPADSQKALFSATMPPAVLELSRRYLKDPKILKVTSKHLTVPSIEQTWYEVRPYQKLDALCRVLDTQNPHKAIVFCSTRQGVDELTSHLLGRGFQADALHGNLSQPQRDRVMKRFRSDGLDILVATDVAARGLDVDDVDAVINYSMPNDVENYVHRIGRTGRAGRTGKAFTFVTPREGHVLRDIMRYTKATITQAQLPSVRDVVAMKTSQLLNEVRAVLETGQLTRYTTLVEGFLDDGITSQDMAAALLKLLMLREFGEVEAQQEASGGRGEPKLSGKGMVRLFFNVGHKMKVGPRDIVGAVAGETGLPGRIVGAIDIRDRFTFVDVVEEHAQKVLETLNGKMIRGVRLAVDKAIPPPANNRQG